MTSFCVPPIGAVTPASTGVSVTCTDAASSPVGILLGVNANNGTVGDANNNFVTCTAANAPVRGCPAPPAFFAANSGNKITGAFTVGINIAGSSNVVRGNYIDPPLIGISLANTAKGNDVRGNLVFADGGGSRGIEVLGPFPVTDSIDVPPDTIRENRIGDGTNPNNTPNAYGIFCSDRAARINNNLILGTEYRTS
jgi:hypothetical protein